MSDSVVLVRAVVRGGSIVDLEIRQEHQPAPPAGMFWPRPRRVDGVLALIRRAFRMERELTKEAARA